MYCIRNRVSFIIVCVALLLFVTGCSTPEFDHVRLMLQLPFIDDYGNVTWEHSALVVMSRATYESVNWNNFAGESLWLIADEVDRDKRIAWK